MNNLEITDDKQLKEIKEEFNAKFPHLKLEFFKEEHTEGQGNSLQSMYKDSLFLKDIRKNHTEGIMSINGHLKTSTFENNFKEHFGINAQVWRKAGKIWLQTITTAHWTLTEQEERSRETES